MLFQKTENFKLFWYSLFYTPRYFFEKWEKHCRRCAYVASAAMFFILSPAANQQIRLEYPPGYSIQYPIPAVFGLPVKTVRVRLYQSRQKLTVRRILVWQPGTRRIRFLLQQGIQGASASGFPQRGKAPVHHDGGTEGIAFKVFRCHVGVSVPGRVPDVSA